MAVVDEASISRVREAIRDVGTRQGLDEHRRESLVTTASELAWNQLRHAGGGDMLVRPIARDGQNGVEVTASDRGPGITNPAAALAGATPAPTGLGAGLAGAYRLADEMDFDLRAGEGSQLTARKFAAPVPRREVALFGRPLPGESVSGDDGIFFWCDRMDDRLLVTLVDGLGHGRDARTAARQAIGVLLQQLAQSDPVMDPATLLRQCHPLLQDTRGAVMGLGIVNPRQREMQYAAIGNINTHLYHARQTTRLGGTAGTLGGRIDPTRRFLTETVPLQNRQILVMFTDGISSRLNLSTDPVLLRQPPIAIADQLVRRNADARDDITVMVAII